MLRLESTPSRCCVRQAAPELNLAGRGWWESRSALEEALLVIEFVTTAMAEEGFPEHDIFEMRQALQEAIGDAVQHGNGGDPSRLVRVRYQVHPERVLVEVETDSPERGALRSEEALEPAWRLLRSLVTWVDREDESGRLTLCKYRSAWQG